MVEIKIPFLEKILKNFIEWVKKDRRKILPYEDIVIGTYKIENLYVDILAYIKLDENIPLPKIIIQNEQKITKKY